MGKISIGTSVFSKEGLEAGEVDRVVLDPATGGITHLALRSKGQLTRDVVVPIEMVARFDEQGVWLDRNVLALEAVPSYSEGRYVTPQDGELPLGDYQHGEVLLPVAQVGRATAYEADVRSGKPVECRDGVCGTVDVVLVDPVTGRALSFVMKRAGALSRDVVVPVEWVLDTAGERVALDCSVRQLEELLPVEREVGGR